LAAWETLGVKTASIKTTAVRIDLLERVFMFGLVAYGVVDLYQTKPSRQGQTEKPKSRFTVAGDGA